MNDSTDVNIKLAWFCFSLNHQATKEAGEGRLFSSSPTDTSGAEFCHCTIKIHGDFPEAPMTGESRMRKLTSDSTVIGPNSIPGSRPTQSLLIWGRVGQNDSTN